jgi:hypothetical protein
LHHSFFDFCRFQISNILYSSHLQQTSPEKLTLASCTRRVSEFEKRFCFDLTFDEKVGQTLTLQALSEEDRKAWLSAMDGKEPVSFFLHNANPKTYLCLHFTDIPGARPSHQKRRKQ